MNKLLILIAAMSFSTCQVNKHEGKVENGNAWIDSFISKYDSTDFTAFTNTFIGIRQHNISEVIYIVSKPDLNLPVYFVKYDLFRGTITEINKPNLTKAGLQDYFTEQQIEESIRRFRKYDFMLLKVDSIGNVFFNPYEVGAPPSLLRLKSESTEKKIKRGFIFRHYKGKWYVRD